VIHLDTSFLIRAMVRGSEEAGQLQRLLEAGERLSMSAVSWAEFCCGPADQATIAVAGRLVGSPVPFAGRHARTAAALFNRTGRRRGSFVDCMIAATAIEAGAAIATSNPADFGRFEDAGLRLST